jgi:hypothetical protein
MNKISNRLNDYSHQIARKEQELIQLNQKAASTASNFGTGFRGQSTGMIPSQTAKASSTFYGGDQSQDHKNKVNDLYNKRNTGYN